MEKHVSACLVYNVPNTQQVMVKQVTKTVRDFSAHFYELNYLPLLLVLFPISQHTCFHLRRIMFLHHETLNEFLEMTIKNTIVVSIKRIMYLLYFYYNNSYAYGTDNKA